MKKQYETPVIERIEFKFSEQVVACSGNERRDDPFKPCKPRHDDWFKPWHK